ncbi:alpha-keto acid decarboxylase family protein [Mycolicibacterium sp. CH28]|uniref:alpha-keto acid decarboxylase family protein n=1 Tax=Mycolicibacterium sp. CH28 TaxID=2512237 RepID=UPI001080EB87|nr:thiamine pyrophosphate-binding protein [Mycolicibacterium sp. CH28]TGD89182.1 alpha-keto acid decarboxylase family protein [Mycolicibacterium sp. CH28]
MAEAPKVIEYVLGRLHQIGVSDVFGVPGDYAFPVHDAIVAHPDINWIGCCNELNAGFAADGYARLRGVGAVTTTFGVGELGAISAIAGAYAERLPVFHLTGMPNRSAQADRALVHHTLGNGEFDLFKQMANTVTAASAIITPANVVAETERLIATALYERRPVYLAFPSDVVDQPVAASSATLPRPASDPQTLGAAADAVAAALNRADTACVLPGLLLDRLGIAEAATQLIETASLPFAAMFADKSVIDENHPNFIGMYDGRLMDPNVRDFVESADLVVAIGTMQTDFNTGAFTAHLDPARTVDIQLHSARVGATVFHDVEIADLLLEIAERELKTHARVELQSDTPVLVGGLADDAIIAEQLYPRWANFIAPDDIVIAETGTCSMGLAFDRLPHGARFYNQALWGAIGWATPAALGAAVAEPARRVLLFTGDGSHQVTAQDICQFHRLGLKPIIFVLNNSGYLIERLLCTDPNIAYNDIAPWNYAALPHALGCEGWFTTRVTTLGELDEALSTAASCQTAVYIEVVTGAYEYPPLAGHLHDNVSTLYHLT